MADKNSTSVPAEQPVIESTERRGTSIVTRTVQNGRAVYAKSYLAGDWGRTLDVVTARTQREHALIERLRQSGLIRGRLGLVRIVSADPLHAQLVTEEVPGSGVDQLIQGRFRRPEFECLSALWLAGRWLKRLQQLELHREDRVSISQLDPVDLGDYCKMRLDKLAEHAKRPLSREHGIRLIAAVRKLVEGAKDADRRLVWAHADYTPGNMIWDGHILTPIDFAMAHADRPLLDVTYFIHRLEMLRVYRPWKRWPIATWKRAFLRGYGRPDAEDSSMYRALMIRHHLCRLLTYLRRPPRDLKQEVHDKWVRGVVVRKLSRLV